MAKNDIQIDYTHNLYMSKIIDQTMPSIIRLEYRNQNEINQLKELNQHLKTLFNKLDYYKKPFNIEIDLLNKFIVKNQNALRKEISVNLLKKLKKLLSSYKLANLEGVLGNLNDNSGVKNAVQYYLSAEYYEYLLVKLYSTIHLLDVSLSLCKTINKYIFERICNAIYMPNNIIFKSLVSRIYTIIKCITVHIISGYNCLRKNLSNIKKTNLVWSTWFNVDDYPLNIELKSYDLDNSAQIITQEDNETDLGIAIERIDDNLEIESTNNKNNYNNNHNHNNNQLKWKKKLFKNYNSILNENKKPFKHLKKHINKKINKFGNEYTSFLIGIKKIFIKKYKNKKVFFKIEKYFKLNDYV